MLLEHALDAGRADAAFEAADDALLLDQEQRRHGLDVQALREIGLLGDVEVGNAEPPALLAGEMCKQALHPSCRPGAWLGEEGEQRSLDGHAVSIPGRPALQTGIL
jgi:hypothetical protein